jgi:hypothetical protein
MRLAEKVDWVVGFLDECWWSRVAQPNLHSFSEEGEPLRLVEQSLEKDDPPIRRPSLATECTRPSSEGRGCVSWTGVR